MDVLKVGFIGTGPRANSIFNNLVLNKNLEDKVEITCALDRDPNMLKEWRLKVRDNGTFSNLDDMLKFHDLDAVLIITPPSTHAGFAEKCLQAGLHIWSEVPMGLTNDELFRIIDAEKSNKGNNGKYFYGENYCYMNHIQFVKEKYQNNRLGEVYYTEGEYCHSVEHYMIFENFLNTKGIEYDVDPELAKDPKPTWRATFQPITYGHHVGPCFYVLNKNPNNIPEIPVEVSGYGNMKMLKRFNTDNFQICLCKTNKESIGKFKAGFVMAHHGRIYHTFWATRGLFESEYYNGKNYYLEIPEDQAAYPKRHMVKGRILDDKEINKKSSEGGHGGADPLMFETWVNNILNHEKMDIDAVSGAEWTSVGICALESIKTGKSVKIPNFR